MTVQPATASHRAQIPPFHVMDVWAAAGERQRTHGDLVNLSAGQPSTPAPAAVREAATAALAGDVLGYTVALGIPPLRGRDRRALRADRYELDVAGGQVVVTTGSSGGFLLAFLAAFDAGDRVAMARPGYPCYRNILSALGCEVVELPCGPQTRYQPTVGHAGAAGRAGARAGAGQPGQPDRHRDRRPPSWPRSPRCCERTGIQLVSDEIYHGITLPGRARDGVGVGRPRGRRSW